LAAVSLHFLYVALHRVLPGFISRSVKQNHCITTHKKVLVSLLHLSSISLEHWNFDLNAPTLQKFAQCDGCWAIPLVTYQVDQLRTVHLFRYWWVWLL